MYLQYHNFWTVSPSEWKSSVLGIIEFLVKEENVFYISKGYAGIIRRRLPNTTTSKTANVQMLLFIVVSAIIYN